LLTTPGSDSERWPTHRCVRWSPSTPKLQSCSSSWVNISFRS